MSSFSRSTKSAASVSPGTGRNVAAASLVGQARVTLGSRIGGLLRGQVRTLASSTACLVPRKRKIEAVPVSELEKGLLQHIPEHAERAETGVETHHVWIGQLVFIAHLSLYPDFIRPMHH